MFFINNYHVLCLTHILNFVVEVFHTDQHLIMLTSSLLLSNQPFLKKLVEKSDTLNGFKVTCLRNK